MHPTESDKQDIYCSDKHGIAPFGYYSNVLQVMVKPSLCNSRVAHSWIQRFVRFTLEWEMIEPEWKKRLLSMKNSFIYCYTLFFHITCHTTLMSTARLQAMTVLSAHQSFSVCTLCLKDRRNMMNSFNGFISLWFQPWTVMKIWRRALWTFFSKLWRRDIIFSHKPTGFGRLWPGSLN